jgi:fructokinase
VIVVGGEALVDLVDDDGSVRPMAGGGPFNTAVALGNLEVPVGFLGAISRDAYGEMLSEQLVDFGVDISLVRRSDAPTARAHVRRERDGSTEYNFEVRGTSLADFSPADLPVLPHGAWAVHVGTLALALDPPAAAYEALVQREAERCRIILDPNVRPAIFGDVVAYRSRFERLVQLADVVKLSEDDAAWIYPDLRVNEVIELILGFGPRVVAVTRGKNGAVAASGDSFVDVAGIPVAVVDTIGAGDTFGAAFIAALMQRAASGPQTWRPIDESTLAQAVEYAVAASAVTCTRAGAVPPSRDEIQAQLAALSATQLTAGKADVTVGADATELGSAG